MFIPPELSDYFGKKTALHNLGLTSFLSFAQILENPIPEAVLTTLLS
jgi:hypothetical protein